MKINKIAFKNINSLKGEQEIDFTKTPISDAGIFAITGITGSGKSTLLDVITLALYNRVPRFSGSKKISKKSIEEMGSIVTLLTDDAYAEVEYSVGDRTYRSRWSISKNRNGKFRDYHMELSDVKSEKIFDKRKGEVPNENTKIIGLNYEQFVKSVLLAQGKFAKFLAASQADRSQLLEDITGTGIYRKLGKMAFEREKEERTNIQVEKDKLDIIETLSEEHIQELTKEIASAEKTISTVNGKITKYVSQIDLKTNLEKLKKELEENNLETKENTSKILAFNPSELLIKLQDQLNPLRVDIASYIQNEKNKISQSRDLAEHNAKEQYQKKRLTASIDRLKNILKEEDISVANFLPQLTKLERKLTKITTQLETIEKGKEEIQEDIKKEMKSSESSVFAKLKKLTSPDEARLFLIKEKEDLIAVLNQLNPSKKAPKSLQTALENVMDKLKKLEQLKVQVEEQNKVEAEINLIEKKINDDANLLHVKEKEVGQLNKEVDQIDQKIKDIEIEKDQQLRIHSVTEIRSALEEGSPCPVCGAEDHPYTKQKLVNKIGKLTIELDRFSAKKKEQSIRRQTGLQLIATVVERMKITRSTKKILLVEKKTAINTIKSLKIGMEQNIPILSTIKELQIQKENLAKSINSQKELETVERVLLSYERLLEKKSQYKNLSEQKSQLFTADDFETECTEMRENFSSATSELSTLSTLIEQSKKAISKIEKSQSLLSSTLSKQLLILNISSIEEANNLLLEDHKIQSLKAEQEILKDRQKELATLSSQLEKQYQESLKQDDKTTTLSHLREELKNSEIQRDQLHQTKGAHEKTLLDNKEKVVKQAKYQKRITAMENTYRKWKLLCDYIGDATGNTFANYVQGLTLAKLVGLANYRLRDLDDRYLLQKNQDGSELIVIDQHQGNLERSVHTLSGGETFLVSMALALGLSDLASNQMNIQSLFIDEGFSSLSAEILDKALTTLEKLQSENQKTIGVISHVDSLKERIHTQIQLKKTPQGYSTISIVG